MDNHSEEITHADVLSALKLSLHSLLELGLPAERIMEEVRDQLQLLCSSPFSIPSLDGIELKPSSRVVVVYDKGVSVSLARRMIWQGSQKVLLTPNETKLMKVFMTKPGETITHDELVMHIHGEPILDVDPAEITRPWLSRLRQKLAALPGAAGWIESVRGVGYVFVGIEAERSEAVEVHDEDKDLLDD